MSIKAINAYQKDSLKQRIATADPHQLTLMLMQGAIDRLAYAKGSHERGDVKARTEFVSKAMGIFINLRDTLNMEVGGEFSNNLYSLYEYIIDKLVSLKPDTVVSTIDEIIQLFSPIKEAWQEISHEDKQKAHALQSA